MRRTRVIYWNNIPAPYMVDRWNAIVRRGQIDLEVWLSARIASDRSWDVDESTWEFPFRYLPSANILGKIVAFPVGIFSTNADALVSLYAAPEFLIGSAVARTRGLRTAFWVEATSDSWTRRHWWKEALKRWIFPRMDGIITTGPSGRSFSKRYGAPEERIHVARYGVDIAYYRAQAQRARPKRTEIRAGLGLSGTTFLYVGRLWFGKGLDALLTAFLRLQQESPDVSLLIVGDGTEESHLKERCDIENISNVVFHPFMQRSVLSEAYIASDVFVFPTLGDPYGLVVDEAMACSLPIIATSAAGEIQTRVFNDVNGYIVEPGSPEQLFRAMSVLANSPEKHTSMGLVSSDIIATNTPDNFAQAFEQAIASMLA